MKDWKIIYKHEGEREVIDSAPTLVEARRLVGEYKQAFNSKEIYITLTK
jgi:hypothetical protein